MTQKETIKYLADKILTECVKAHSPSLYNGKAGYALSLFIASGSLREKQMEEKALILMQEALIVNIGDLSFEDGLAGVGYVLLYLIENRYLEADFDEIFSLQYKQIIHILNRIDKEPLQLLRLYRVIYFLTKVRYVKVKDFSRIQASIKKIFEGLELFLMIQFNDFADLQYINKKEEVLDIFKTCLKLIDYSDYSDFSRIIIDDYATLFRKGKIVSSLEIGYYLQNIAEKNNMKGYEDVIHENIYYGTKHIYSCTLSLKESIELEKSAYRVKNEAINEFEKLSDMQGMNIEKMIRHFEKTADRNCNPFGYGAGLARLLIYLTDKNIELL